MLEEGLNQVVLEYFHSNYNAIVNVAKVSSTKYILKSTFKAVNNQIPVGEMQCIVSSLSDSVVKPALIECLQEFIDPMLSFDTTELDKTYHLVFRVIDRKSDPSDDYYYVHGSAYADANHTVFVAETDEWCYSEQWEGMTKEDGLAECKDHVIASIIRTVGLG